MLGVVEIHHGDEVLDIGPPQQRRVLVALGVDAGSPVMTETLIDRVWDEAPDGARRTLQVHLTRLRRLFERIPHDKHFAGLVRRSGGYMLDIAPERVDLHRFARLTQRASDPHLDDRERVLLLREAVTLWRGQPLTGVAGEWPARVRETWRQRYLDGIMSWAEVERRAGDPQGVVARVIALLAEYPLEEPLVALLMRSLHELGRAGAALDHYARIRRRLADELGTDPGPQLQQLHQAILRAAEFPADRRDTPKVRPSAAPAQLSGDLHRLPGRRDAPAGLEELLPPDAEAPSRLASVHRQLPPDFVDFVGRDAELRMVHQISKMPRESDAAPKIVVIEGMGGVGKTRLAVRCAHELVGSGRYDDLQLYVDLRGYSHDSPADPAAVLGSFIRLMGAPGACIPDDLDGRAAMYRDRLHDRRVLVLLDNAAALQQVLPLLPGTATALVLITSRRAVPIDGANTIALDVFSVAEAEHLLVRIVGPRPVAADPEAAHRLIDLCGRLPLAVALAARRLRSRPALRLIDLVNRLQDRSQRLDELIVGDQRVDAVFDLSIRALDADSQRLFRRLGVHPGDDFTAESAAAVAGATPSTAQCMLDRLIDEHLVLQITADRYRLHDLLRHYARGQADGRGESDAAVADVVVWYLHAADAAVRTIFPHERDVQLDDGKSPSRLPDFENHEQALSWLTAEHATLIACVNEAFVRGKFDVAWQLPAVLRQYFECYSHREEWIRTSRIALEATKCGSDRSAEALVLSVLGLAYGHVNRFDLAIDYLDESLTIRRTLGDREGEGKTLNNLGVAYARRGSLDKAIECLSASLDIRREHGSLYLETVSLNNLGLVYTKSGRHEDAVACFQRVVDVRARLGDRIGLGSVLCNLGEALLRAGQYDPAITRLRQTLQIQQQAQVRGRTAEVLDLLGQALSAKREFVEAEECWRTAIRIFDELGHPQAREVQLRLGQPTHPHATGR